MVYVKPALDALPPSDAPGEELYFGILCDFGIALVEYRRAHNLTQKALADLLNVSQVMVSKYENGSFQVSLKVMCEICAKLNLSLDVRFGAPQPESPYNSASGLVSVPVPVAASLPDLAFGLDSECEFSSAYHFSKLLDQFSIALSEYRLQHDLGQKDLADLLQISQSMVSQYENGSRNISLKTLCEHCEKLRLVPRLSFDCSSEASSVQPTNSLQLPESDSLSSQFA